MMLMIIDFLVETVDTGLLLLPQDFDYGRFKSDPVYKKQIIKTVFRRLLVFWVTFAAFVALVTWALWVRDS